MEDLIKNAHSLFDEPSQSAPLSSSNVAETMSAYPHGSLVLSPELRHPTTQHHLGLVGGIPTSSQLSFSTAPSDATTNSHPTPPPITLLNPLMGLSSSRTLAERVETATQEPVVLKARTRTAAEGLPNSTPPDAVYIPAPMSVAEWRLHQSRLPQIQKRGRGRKAYPQACYQVRRIFHSLLPRACKLGLGDSRYDMYLFLSCISYIWT